MDYIKAMDALSESDGLARIPDSWAQTPAFPMELDGTIRAAVLFYTVSGGEARVRRLLTVDGSGAVDSMEPEELGERFKLPEEEVKVLAVSNYDTYFEKKDRYNALLPGLFASPAPNGEAAELLRAILGDEFFEKLLSPLSPGLLG